MSKEPTLFQRLEYTMEHWDSWPLSTQVHQITSCFADWIDGGSIAGYSFSATPVIEDGAKMVAKVCNADGLVMANHYTYRGGEAVWTSTDIYMTPKDAIA